MPLDVMRGRLAGMLGTPTDLANLLKSPMPTEMFGETNYEPAQQLPYGSEYFLKNLPLAPTSRVGEVAGQAGSFVPLNPMPAARAAAAGVKALGPTAGRMAEQYLTRTGGILPLDVYHGTPHRFPPTATNPLGEFDASKIGTGEGAQAYGHGLYFAENPKVADEYAGKLSKPFVEFASGLPENIYEKAILEKLNSIAGTTQLEARGTSVRSAFNEFMNPRMWKYDPRNPKANSYNGTVSLEGKELETAMAYKKAAERLGSPTVYDTGSLYKVDLPDEQIAKMLDFDKPLKDQTPEIQALAKQYGLTDADHLGGDLVAAMNAKRATGANTMRQAGIPGIKYLDEGSRGAGKGTRNFVVFPSEEKSLTILERNGQPGQNSLKSFIK